MGLFSPFFEVGEVLRFGALFRLFHYKYRHIFAKKQAKKGQIRVNLLFTLQNAAVRGRHSGLRWISGSLSARSADLWRQEAFQMFQKLQCFYGFAGGKAIRLTIIIIIIL